VVLLFPTMRPVTAENMNYAGAVGAFIGIFSLGWWWAGARKHVNTLNLLNKLTNVPGLIPDREHKSCLKLLLRKKGHRMIVWMGITFIQHRFELIVLNSQVYQYGSGALWQRNIELSNRIKISSFLLSSLHSFRQVI